MKFFRAGLLSLLSLTAPLLASESMIDTSSLFSGPLGETNHYNLLLTTGMDEVLDESAITFGTGGFTELGWDQAKIDQYRNAAIAWFIERFGIDFSQGYYDAASGTVSTDIGILVPISYSGKLRVIASNNYKIPPYTFLTPSVIRAAIYVVVFTGAPFNYGGTYANGTSIPGDPTENLNYSCHRIYLNRSETKHETFFLRNFYPNPNEKGGPIPDRVTEKMQIFSPTFGPGFCNASSAVPSVPNIDGKYPTHIRASWSFPGSFTIPDWNGFTEAPVSL